jgi:hypothetical protein
MYKIVVLQESSLVKLFENEHQAILEWHRRENNKISGK